MKFSKLVSKWRGSLDWWISAEPGNTWFYKGNIGDMSFPLYLAIADLKVIWYGDWDYVKPHFEVRLSRPENEERFEELVKRYGVKDK